MSAATLPDPELDPLLEALCEQTLDAEELSRLNVLLASEREARKRYLLYMELHGGLHWDQATRQPISLDDGSGPVFDAAVTGPADEWALEDQPQPKPRASLRPIRRPMRGRAWGTAAVIALAAALTFILLRGRNGEHQSVQAATVTASANAKWEAAPSPRSLTIGSRLALTSGCGEITFANGGRIVLEGPARVRIDSPMRLFLFAGKLAASVQGGFSVETPNAKIIDLGTEFGIRVGDDGLTEVDVFKGRVEVVRQSSGPSQPGAQTVTEGQALTVSAVTIAPVVSGASFQRFVRSISAGSASLDVVDLLCGGDGTTHRRGMAIDVRDGRAGKLPQIGGYVGDGEYHRVPTIPAIDGCFVPNGSGKLPVDSAGHVYRFPANNQSATLISAGGPIPPPGPGSDPMGSVLGGVDYAQSGHGHIAMHSNKGLTIDLDAIRRLYPVRKLSRFHCVAGSSFLVGPGESPGRRHVDLSILIDGSLAFERRRFANGEPPFAVDLPLKDTDRFLTLAATDGGDGITNDYVLLGDPIFDLGIR